LTQTGTKFFFISDFHLGIPDYASSLNREKLFVKLLDEAKHDAAAIYLMGDIFDFWFEYNTVIPKGFARLFGKLAEITDSGIPVHLFRGNHDIWAFNYLEKELNIQLHRTSEVVMLGGRKFFLSHGDGLGPGDKGYKFIKWVFERRINQWLFRWIHPDFGSRMALYFSRKSRIANVIKEGRIEKTGSFENERLIIFSREKAVDDPSIDFFIFGHRHLPLDIRVSENARCIILGDWVTNFTYAVFDGEGLLLKQFIED
jgi:UDP-2,3-diacylglucosamine hydrolase